MLISVRLLRAALLPSLCRRFRVLFALLACSFAALSPVTAQTDQLIYDEALGSGWENWSWASVNLASTAETHGGALSIAVTPGAWSALSLRHAPFDSTGYGNVTFWINGGTIGGQTLRVFATLNDSAVSSGVSIAAPAPNTWTFVSIPLASLAADNATNFTGVWIQEFSGTDSPTFYVDDVVLTGSVPTIPPPPLVGMALYQDSYTSGWDNWSWAAVNTGNTNPVNSGTSSIAVDADAFEAVRFHHAPLDTRLFTTLTFWIHGGASGGQTLQLNALLSDVVQPGVVIGPLVADTWQKYSIPLAQLGVANKPDLTDFWLQENTGATIPTFYLDDVRLDFAPPPETVEVRVDARKKLQVVDPRLFGLNTAIWDGAFNTVTTAELLNELDNQALRFPGGSISDVYHWQTNMSEGETFEWATSFDDFAAIADTTQATVYITVNYGTGTPEEAAAWVREANITKGLGVKYWEVGNENYGAWEADNNTRPHDPVTYVTRFKEYVRQMKAVDRSIKVGAVILADEDSFANYSDQSAVNPRTGETHQGWSAVMLAAFKQQGFTPDFVVYHRYEQGPGGESDVFLLNSARSWPEDAARIRQMLQDYLGKDGRKVEINCTENNSVFSNPGKQTTSLVNGLFLADALGNIMQTEFRSFFWWDLRNGQEAGNNNSSLLYGWRRYGDYGIVNYATPAGPADRYPTFYVYKLLQHYARGGEKVVVATSNYPGLGAYAVRDGDDSLRLLLINKHATATLPVTVRIQGFVPEHQAEVYHYGIPEDEAARTGTGSADVQQGTVTLSGSGSTFTTSTAPYSATVIRLRARD